MPHAVIAKSFQNNTPKTCGAEIKGLSIMVATGFEISHELDQRTEFQESASPIGESGGGQGGRLDFRLPASLYSQSSISNWPENIKSMANGLTSVAILIRIIADQTSNGLMHKHHRLPKNFSTGKFNTENEMSRS